MKCGDLENPNKTKLKLQYMDMYRTKLGMYPGHKE
jgi:hypothetical protein